MKAAFYSGATGLLAYQSALDTIGNNIANVSTTGFRGQNASFENLLYTRMYANVDPTPLSGNGVRMPSPTLRTTQGSIRQTGNQLDFAIMGSGMFAVEYRGQVQYTRDGAFQLSLEDGGAFLTTLDGAYLLDGDQQRIELQRNEETGQYDTAALLEQLAVFQFDNEQGMTPVSGNRFLATDVSGEAVLSEGGGEYNLLPGYLEQSNVVLADEMVDMITAQRSFQVSARVLQVADENEQTVNSLRR